MEHDRDAAQSLFQRVIGRRLYSRVILLNIMKCTTSLGQEHHEPVQSLDEEGVSLRLEKLQPNMSEDGRFNQLD